ncbi:MAG TPA: hypothetical protein VMC10_12345 [Stellaceae bacterium]|nr:hypothetical protein [Stellaceae bacterium]HUN46571.1 hypothetical protein [Stellaceae bacterium]
MALFRYLVLRLGEASTWAALAGLLAGVHVSIDPGLWQHIVDAGIAVSALAGCLIPEAT